MRFSGLIPDLTVEDIERTKDFHIGILQFNIEYERPEDKFVFLSLENIQIMFDKYSQNLSVKIINIFLVNNMKIVYNACSM